MLDENLQMLELKVYIDDLLLVTAQAFQDPDDQETLLDFADGYARHYGGSVVMEVFSGDESDPTIYAGQKGR